MNNGDRKSFEKSIHVVLWLGSNKTFKSKIYATFKNYMAPTHVHKLLGIWFAQDLKECEVIIIMTNLMK